MAKRYTFPNRSASVLGLEAGVVRRRTVRRITLKGDRLVGYVQHKGQQMLVYQVDDDPTLWRVSTASK